MSERERRDSGLRNGDARRFAGYLKQSGMSCLVVDQTKDHAVLVFTGPFEGGEVVWRCEFVTLKAELQRLILEGSRAVEGLRNFIEIGDPVPDGVPLRVGLALTHIDAAAIDKMILMIRQYKNLRRGRHEYGEVVQLR
ncbi:hypothetical protein [Thiogranum longum]|nr:hypothetical protein [Thiogranum longum]